MKRQRANRGSILFLAVALILLILLPLGLLVCQSIAVLVLRARSQSYLESAALLAASRMSKVVVNDPQFGFISLSNQPPIGKATLAQDGEPCPVRSINNCLGTVRLDMLIAGQLESPDMTTLVEKDYTSLQAAETNLQKTLQTSVSPDLKSKICDSNGNEIKIYAEVKRNLEDQLASCGAPATLSNLRISLGWLKDAGTTNTPVPMPLNLSGLKDGDAIQGNYKSCVDFPTCKHSFFFAPVSKETALADSGAFSPPDGKRFCSVVKVEADIQYSNLLGFNLCGQNCLHLDACAVPKDTSLQGPAGAMVVFFPGGLVPQFKSLSSFLLAQDGETTRYYQATNGDLNADANATPIDTQALPWTDTNLTSGRVAATAIYSWLKGAATKPRIDTTLAALNADLSNYLVASNIVYEFDREGKVVTASLPNMPLPLSVLSDQQVFVETRSQNYVIGCYDNVFNAGTINGGKHAGQPLEGDPINWCNLSYYGLNDLSASTRGKGASTGLEVVGMQDQSSNIPGAVSNDLAAFKINGTPVSMAPRKTYYSGGLAVELAINVI
jgi:hypothetical protein